MPDTKPACKRPGCPLNGQIHPVCVGHSRSRDYAPCTHPPRAGAYACRFHGGATPAAKTKAAQRVAQAEAERSVALFAARRDIAPADALLDLVHWTAGEVDYWRQRVRQLAQDDESALTWGVVREKSGGGDHGTTQEARPNVAYVMLERASDRLAQYAAAALKAGVDERRVRLAESQGALVAEVIRGVLEDLQLSPAQELLVGEVVPRRLRALAAGGGA